MIDKLNEYQRKCARTINIDLHPQEIENHALFGMASEVGEIHAFYQKVYQGHIIDDDDLKHEIGDLMWFICELCTVNGWDLSEIATMNIDKLIKRYPNGFEAERSLNR